MAEPSPPVSAIHARPPRGGDGLPPIVRDADRLAPRLEDAAHFPGGHATELVTPATERDVAEALRSAVAVLPIGAQSSLTGGATPMGERLLSTERLNAVEWIGSDLVRVQAGVTLADLDTALAGAGRYYPPGPTFTGAFIGGMISTNAAGAATFKYGATREWVQALTVVLSEGDVLDINRGAVRADGNGCFDLELSERTARVQVPTYRMPQVRKLSAGYFAAPGMDLVDLFVGSEGTLGVITAATLRILPARPAWCLALVALDSRDGALALAGRLRDAARKAWQTRDSRGVDVSAIEFLDRRCLALINEDNPAVLRGIGLRPSAAAALLVTLELPANTTADAAFDDIARAGESAAADTPLGAFCAILAESRALDDAVFAPPGDHDGIARLLAVREAAPDLVNRRVGLAKRDGDARIAKIAADIVVPVERLADLLAFCDAEADRRKIDILVWGHVSDGNLHPNVLPRSYADVEAGQVAVLAIGREAVRLGGAPLAEHGVGRSAIKQQLLRELYGERGIDEMRAVKRAIDPLWKLAPGVLFAKG